MTTKSDIYGGESQQFTFRVEEVEDGRFKATCITHPDIFAFGDSERHAMINADHKMYEAVMARKV